MIKAIKNDKIYKFQIKDNNILFDINSLNLFEIDKVTSEVIDKIIEYDLKPHRFREVAKRLSKKYKEETIKAIIFDLLNLKKRKLLFTTKRKTFNVKINSPNKPNLTSLILAVADDCNLKCDYCGVDAGKFGGAPAYMKPGIAKKAVDLLIDSSGKKQNLSICFHGGEPLLNLEIIKFIIEYSKTKASRLNKKIIFSILTNGTLLTANIINYFLQNKVRIHLSIDGPPSTHNRMRHFADGKGSFDVIKKNLRALFHLSYPYLKAEAVLTHYNLNYVKTAQYLLKMGFKDIKVAVVGPDYCGENVGGFLLDEKDRITSKKEYTKFIEYYLSTIITGKSFYFGDIIKRVNQLVNSHKRFSPCWVGLTSVYLTPQGDIYPCLNFRGEAMPKLGDLSQGINYSLQKRFLNFQLDKHPVCSQCWAKYLCGGMCWLQHNVSRIDDTSCLKEKACERLKGKYKMVMAFIIELNRKRPDIVNAFKTQNKKASKKLLNRVFQTNRF